jgi:hypothetical protein
MIYTDEEQEADFARLKKKILRRERVARIKMGVIWALCIISALLFIYYAL